jgi:uncharacterized tellurite resistance protein B-like protein
MIDRLFDAFRSLVDDIERDDNPHTDDDIHLAAAALMMEVARSDTTTRDIELKALADILRDRFNLPAGKITELVSAAGDKVEAAHDLYQFTQLINDHYQYVEKEDLLFSMWQVAYADGHIEAIEDHIIRRVAGLIHLDHADFIRLKLKARDTLGET